MKTAHEMIGEAAANLMDNLPEEEITPRAAMVILAYDFVDPNEDGDQHGGVQFHCTLPEWYWQVGLLAAARDVIRPQVESDGD